MKKKKAFTLIELLAVIVILAIISLIVGVTIGNIIDKSKKETYRNSIRNLIKSGEHFVSQYVIDNNKDLTYPMIFTCDGNECSNGTSKLQVSGKVPRSGKIILESSKNIRVEYLYNGSYCASGIKESIQVAKTCADIDSTIPTITAVMQGKNVILTLTDNESGIGSYCVTSTNSFNNCEWINTTSTNVTHPLAVSGTYYAFARDKKLNVSDSIMFDTGDIEDPSLTSTLDGKVISSTFSDNVAVTHFCLSEEENSENCEWEVLEENQTTKDVTLASAGTYYVYVKDGVGNITRSNGIVAPDTAFCAFEIDYEWTEFPAGTSTAWVAPCNGLYKLEVWGAGSSGGSGGYSVGYKVFTIDETIYVSPGGAGSGSSGGWNGGAGTSDSNYSGNYSGGSGGATHMAYVTGTIASIGKTTFDAQGLLVAGGAGGGAGNWAVGGYSSACGGSGGGTSGGSGCKNTSYENPNGSAGSGGSQTSGYSFGQGGRGGGGVFRAYTGAGGGGYYGGRAASSDSNGYSCVGGGGGSGWIGGVPEIEYKGETYSPSMSNGGNSGAGKAKITIIAY